MNSDPIADMLTRLRNAVSAKNKTVDLPVSKEKKAIAAVMEDHGFISKHETVSTSGPQDFLRITLKYKAGQPAIVKLQRVSRPGLRRYSKSSQLPEILNGLGVCIVSTSKGIMSDKKAKKLSLGGEVLCFVY